MDAQDNARIHELADIEAALVERLSAALTAPGQQHPVVDVASWPGKPDDYRMTHGVGAVLVVFQGTRPQGQVQRGLNPVTHEFQIAVLSRSLREPNVQSPDASRGEGAYQLIQIVLMALLGFEVPNAAGPVAMTEASFSGHDQGVWTYRLSCQIPGVWVMPIECPPGPWVIEGANVCCDTAPEFKQVNYVEA